MTTEQTNISKEFKAGYKAGKKETLEDVEKMIENYGVNAGIIDKQGLLEYLKEKTK
jgi:hypothetical protein